MALSISAITVSKVYEEEAWLSRTSVALSADALLNARLAASSASSVAGAGALRHSLLCLVE